MEKKLKHTAVITLEVEEAEATVMTDVWQSLNELYRRHSKEVNYITIFHNIDEE